jgi:hypothetical protein
VRGSGWDFAVEVEDHVLFFHFGEDGVEGFVGEDAGGGILGEIQVQVVVVW